MGVAYLVPTLGRDSLAQVEQTFRQFAKACDEISVNFEPGMNHALRQAFEQSTADIVRNCADDDFYPPEASRKAVEVMESHPDIDVMVTGGQKLLKNGRVISICVPKGTNYGSKPEDVAHYGACGSGMFMRREAVRKYGLLEYEGHLIDNFIVLKAMASGAKVRFLRLNTYFHRVSVHDDVEKYWRDFYTEKKALRTHFGIWNIERKAHENPAVFDGEFA